MKITKRTAIKTQALCFGVVAILFLNIATQKTDFSGTWSLVDQESISGTLYANGVPKQLKVVQQKDKIAIEKTSLSQTNEDVIINDTLSLEGKPFVRTTSSNQKKIGDLKWSKDDKGFTIITKLYSADDSAKIEITYTDQWNLENGKLIFVRKVENFDNGEVWESKAVYEKLQ